MSSSASGSNGPLWKALTPTTPLQLAVCVLAGALGYGLFGVWGAVAGGLAFTVLAASVTLFVGGVVFWMVLGEVRSVIDDE